MSRVTPTDTTSSLTPERRAATRPQAAERILANLRETFPELKWTQLSSSAWCGAVDDDEPLSVLLHRDASRAFLAELYHTTEGRLLASPNSPHWDATLRDLADQVRNLRRAGLAAPWLESVRAALAI